MKVARSLSQIERERNSVVTVGTFDGVHRAHQEIIREVVNRTRTREGRSVIVTFYPHPKEVVASEKGAVKLLLTMEERIELLGRMNIDLLFIVTFTYDFSRLTSREFYQAYIVNGVGVSEVVVGYDHMFGRDRRSGIEDLVHMGKEFDFSVFAMHPYTVDGEPVSSTRVRRALTTGDIDRARKLLGYPYRLSGSVVIGDRRGKTIGYPTANIALDVDRKVVPAHGVYLVGVEVRGGQWFGMMNIGVRPTVSAGEQETLEVHIFDFGAEIYDERITVTFLRKIRDERRFSSLRELTEQLGRDKEQSLRMVAEHIRQR